MNFFHEDLLFGLLNELNVIQMMTLKNFGQHIFASKQIQVSQQYFLPQNMADANYFPYSPLNLRHFCLLQAWGKIDFFL